MSTMKVAVTVGNKEYIDDIKGLQRLNDVGIFWEHVDLALPFNKDDIINKVKDYDCVLSGADPYNAEILSSLPRLRLIMRHGVGYDMVDIETATKLGIAVANLPGSNADSVAEHALAMMLAVTRKLGAYTDKIRNGIYYQELTSSLSGVVGLVGFGAIGRSLANLLKVFSVKVIAYDPYVSSDTMLEYGVRKAKLEEVCISSDILSLNLPANEKTYKVVDKEFIEGMKDGAFLINTSRGKLIDEKALSLALAQGKIRGAGLDVFDPEPIMPHNELLKMENVIFTPHIATMNIACLDKVFADASDTIIDFFTGKSVNKILNPDYTTNARVGA